MDIREIDHVEIIVHDKKGNKYHLDTIGDNAYYRGVKWLENLQHS